MAYSTLPTLKTWLWLFKKPTLNQEALNELHSNAKNENYWKRLAAGGLWLIFCLFFISIGILFCVFLVGIFYEQGSPLDCSWLRPGGSPFIMLIGIALNIISAIIGVCVASVAWTYMMRSSGFINESTIEMIIRNGPLLAKSMKTKGSALHSSHKR